MNRRVRNFCAIVLLSVASVGCAENVVPKPGAGLVTGILIEGGVECQLFQANDGTQYTLLGNLEGFKNGDKVQLAGEEVEISFCMQGKTLSVKTINKVK